MNIRCIPDGSPCSLGIPRLFKAHKTANLPDLLSKFDNHIQHMATLMTKSEENLHSLTFKSMGILTYAPIIQVHSMILLVVFLNEVIPIT